MLIKRPRFAPVTKCYVPLMLILLCLIINSEKKGMFVSSFVVIGVAAIRPFFQKIIQHCSSASTQKIDAD